MADKATERPLSAKQEAFVREYLIDLNATQAAIRAKYSVNSAEDIGRQLLRKPRVASAIQAEMNKRAARTEITADYVLRTITETIERCKEARPVTDRKGNPVTVETEDGTLAAVFTFDAANVLRGTEQLGKHLKLFTDKVEHSGAVVSMPAEMSDDEAVNVVADRLQEALLRAISSQQAQGREEPRATTH